MPIDPRWIGACAALLMGKWVQWPGDRVSIWYRLDPAHWFEYLGDYAGPFTDP